MRCTRTCAACSASRGGWRRRRRAGRSGTSASAAGRTGLRTEAGNRYGREPRGDETMDVVSQVADGVATIALSRPAKKNALTAPMYQAMADALRAFEADPSVRCIVVHGSAEAFTAGNDLEDF